MCIAQAASEITQVSTRSLRLSVLHENPKTDNPDPEQNTSNAHTHMHPSPCNVATPAALTQVQTIKHECQDNTWAAHASANSIRDHLEMLPTILRWHPGALLPRLSFTP